MCNGFEANDTGGVAQDGRVSIYKEFMKRVNSGKKNEIQKAIKTYYEQNLFSNVSELHDLTNYWLNRHTEFGVLTFDSFGNDMFNDNPVCWFYGRTSMDWVGLDFDFDDNLKIIKTNILRSCIPSYANKRPDVVADSKLKNKLKAYFETLEKENLFSGSVLVAKGDHVLFKGFYGFSDKKKNLKNSEETDFVIASTTKLFTSITTAKLIDEGKMNSTDFISKYLPDFPKHIGNQVTISDLLTHSSGIELDHIDDFNHDIRQGKHIDMLYNTIVTYLRKSPNFDTFDKPSEFDYSNENFDLLAKIIQNVSGVDFYEYLDKTLFKPLGMNSTAPILKNNIPLSLAKTYQISPDNNGDVDGGKRQSVDQVDFYKSRPGGSFKSNVGDMYSLLKSLNDHTLVSEDTAHLFTTRKISGLNLPFYIQNYGYGFFVNERYGMRNYGHAGGKPGVSSRCEYYPGNDIYVIVQSNYNGAANIAANHISELIAHIQ